MARPWMPLYVADYLGDTGHLRTLEHGAYMLLIMHYWQTGGLPTSDDELASICRMSEDEWVKIRGKIARLFDDGWKHKRVEEEIAKADELDSKRSAAGKAGAYARYGKRTADAPQTDSIARGNSQSQSPTQEDSSSKLENSGESPRKSKNGQAYAFEVGCVKLKKPDLDRWIEAFPDVSVKAELTGAEPWLAKEKNWFQAAAGFLAKRQRTATSRAPPRPDDQPPIMHPSDGF